MFRIEYCAKQQIEIDDLSKERASAQIWIKQHSYFRWLRAKAWKQCVRRDSELIATKVCSRISGKWNPMFESHIVTNVDRTSLNFWFEDFLAICLCKQSSTMLLTNHPSRRSVLIFKLSDLTFSRSMSCSISIEQNYAKWKYFNSNLCWML